VTVCRQVNVTNTKVNSAFYPCRGGEVKLRAILSGLGYGTACSPVSGDRWHCDPIWQVTLRSFAVGFQLTSNTTLSLVM